MPIFTFCRRKDNISPALNLVAFCAIPIGISLNVAIQHAPHSLLFREPSSFTAEGDLERCEDVN